jgi:ParB family chromosome partitioning protein
MEQRIVQHIATDRIVGGENVRKRYDEGKISGLARSMTESGLREPIHVIPVPDGRFMLLTGGRRLRAARKAGWETIPAIIEEGQINRSETLVLQIIENVQREELTPGEKARGIDALMKETGWNASQAAAKLGLANGTVSKLLSLLSLPEELQMKIDAGELPATVGYQLSKVDNPEAREELARRAASGELTREGVRKAIKAAKSRPRRTRIAPAIRVTAKLDERQTVSVAAASLDLNSFVSILEKLLNHAQRARSDGLTLETLLQRLASARSKAPGQKQPA